MVLKNRFRKYCHIEKKKQTNKQRQTFRQLCSLNTLSLLKVFTFKLNFDFNLTEHFDSICAKLESTGYYEERYLHFFTVCIWRCQCY